MGSEMCIRDSRKSENPKYINPADQVKVDAKQGRVRMVKMAAETAEAAQEEGKA